MSAVMKALEERGLPSLLALPDGRTAGRAEWESILRPYWRELLLREEYGEQPPLVTINSWNEWTETSYLQPDDLYGYGYLEAVRSVFKK